MRLLCYDAIMSMQDDFIERCQKNLTIISNGVSDILHQEDVFQNRTRKLFQAGNSDPHVQEAIIRSHYTTTLAGIRRQLKTSEGEVSLLKLLEKLSENHRLITVQWYTHEWLKDSSLVGSNSDPIIEQFVQNIPKAEFEENFGKSGVLDKQIVEEDIQKLKMATKNIETYADKRISHWDKKEPPKINETEYLDSLDVINSITRKYILLLNQAGMSDLTPVIQ